MTEKRYFCKPRQDRSELSDLLENIISRRKINFNSAYLTVQNQTSETGLFDLKWLFF